ncbi:hypothetical protein ACFL0C_00535 [Patescibacteria group bacterium]
MSEQDKTKVVLKYNYWLTGPYFTVMREHDGAWLKIGSTKNELFWERGGEVLFRYKIDTGNAAEAQTQMENKFDFEISQIVFPESHKTAKVV